ncbi:hypothetical protein L873DRAFT_1814944 [Choiromyces venosus 120613-1]|uniref:Uncharacterized protein n=1 Tax=Choiromyces venosus 120613-1 TaxID=1336337 RepID=A0A3N4JBJ7_9PEZI|nr:hypothetical protein L873DRAFT_1814944 [Choiromyces venosus 120613-1]
MEKRKCKIQRSDGKGRGWHTQSALGLFTDGIPRFDKLTHTISTRIARVPKNALPRVPASEESSLPKAVIPSG